MAGIKIRPETSAQRLRRFLGLLPWLLLAFLNGRKGWESTALALSGATVVIALILDAIHFANDAPETRPRRGAAFSGILGFLIFFGVFALPILLPGFTGPRLGVLGFMLALIVVAWVAAEVLTFLCRTIAWCAVR